MKYPRHVRVAGIFYVDVMCCPISVVGCQLSDSALEIILHIINTDDDLSVAHKFLDGSLIEDNILYCSIFWQCEGDGEVLSVAEFALDGNGTISFGNKTTTHDSPKVAELPIIFCDAYACEVCEVRTTETLCS